MNFKLDNSPHVTIVVALEIGQACEVKGWGYRLDGKKCIIQDVRLAGRNSQTGIEVKIDQYDGYLDSAWITLL